MGAIVIALLILPVLAGAARGGHRPEGKAVDCTYSAATRTLKVIALGEAVSLRREGGRVQVGSESGEPTACAGGQPTVTNTDTISVDRGKLVSSYELLIDLRGGPLAPGATPEPVGDSEIEIAARLGPESFLQILATGGPDEIRLGRVGERVGVNLNAEEDGDDVDLTVTRGSGVFVLARGGADTVFAQGGPVFTGPLREEFLFVVDGRGRDVITGGPGSDIVFGGKGRDRYRLRGGSDFFATLRDRDRHRDRIHCGAGRGRDFAFVPDRRDRVRNCEQVRRKKFRGFD